MQDIERTLAMVKPDAIHRMSEIEQSVFDLGFTIIQRKHTRLSEAEAREFYNEHQGSVYFNNRIKYMTSGDVYALILEGVDSIAAWRRALGPSLVSEARKEQPESLRAKFGDPFNDSLNAALNALHGSDSPHSAEREIKFFFPNLKLQPVLIGEVAKEYLRRSVSPTLVQGLALLAKIQPEDPIIWLADWLLVNNPNKPLTPQEY